ncbi:hypothetical protein [Pseudomonas aeruginosa]|uniref:hypothetical protein n=1 Tax=Pseudomonas aeruginosa TaxID=287 RepID=UPI001968FD7B|nr:hypothetical protein [Pseudomonas aeruginosa]
MTNELTDVCCPCGDEFPADSYDAGFIAGSGMCQNCDAALPPKDICTCPSGDGSLRHPCPAHPESVELAGVAAKLTFINGRPAMCGCQVEYSSGGGEYSDVIYVTLCAKHSGSAILDLVATNRIALTPEYEGQWHADLYLDREIPLAKAEGASPAEAVLALMSAERIDPEQESVEQAGGDEREAAIAKFAETCPMTAESAAGGKSYDIELRRYYLLGWDDRAALAQPSPASDLDPLNLAPHAGAFNEAPDEALRPEQAEAERPEVVARVVHSNPFVLDHCGPLNANDELMTVAQHAASVARWAEMFNRVEQERDAALARVAELERELRNEENAHTTTIEQRDNAEHWADQLAKAIAERLGVDIGEHSNLNCPWNEALVWMQQPPEQAQHSVPRAWLDVQAERRRQVEVEGYHGFRDSHYINYELSKAARAYIEVSWHALSGGLPCKQPESWPWMAGFTWSDGRTMLVKACALTLAEIERLDRAAAPGKEVGHE